MKKNSYWILWTLSLFLISLITLLFFACRQFKEEVIQKIKQKHSKNKVRIDKSLLDNTQYSEIRSITKYLFSSLVDQFIKNPAHKDIVLYFKDDLSNEEEKKNGNITLGNSRWKISKSKWTFFGFKVFEYDEYYYEISFINNYPSLDYWRQTIVHEFTHLWFYTKGILGLHKHNDKFYAKMDYFEDWLDKKYEFSPRKNKWADWEQHINPARKKMTEARILSSYKIKVSKND